MSYLEGRTLEERLTEEGPLPIDDAMKIATEVGDALKRAHAAGIVHRDIKPANIMLTEGGQAVVMDFGLAKGSDMTHLTKTGTTLGTAAYMSPEQMQGRTVDARADLWALGVLLYEMVTGKVPFGGDNLPAVAYAVQHREPASPAGMRPEVSADLEKVIDRTLSKDPGQRYQTAEELLGDLEAVRNEQDLALKTALYDHRQKLKLRKRFIFSVLATVLVAAVAMVWWARHQDLQRIDALAVLPFANLSGDKEQEYFSDGMTEALITELAQLASDQMRVIGRTSVMSFKGSSKSLPEIAAELGVDVVVEASVIRSGNLVKVAAKLIRARPEERQLWAETYERDFSDILSLHADLAREVASQIQLVLSPETRACNFEPRTVDPEAYEDYLKGRHFLLNLDLSGVQRKDAVALKNFHLIKTFFTKSIQRDSTFAPAWAGLAQYHIQREHNGIGSHAIQEAHAAATKAIELDDCLGEAHSAMGHILWEHQYRPREAARELRRAMQLNPNDPFALALYSYFSMTMGNFTESTKSIRKALELDPLSRFIQYTSSHPLMCAGMYDEAIRQIDKYHEAFPDTQHWTWGKTTILMKAGRFEEALALIEGCEPREDFLNLHLRVPWLLMELDRPGAAREYLEKMELQAIADSAFHGLSLAYSSVGNKAEAIKWLDEYERSFNPGLFSLATVAVNIGDIDRTFAYLEKAYENNNWYLTRLAYLVENEPDWKVLATDPRYHDLVRRMGLRD